jgi:hypothetical protein
VKETLPREVHLERSIGRKVSGPDGRPVGRLEDARVERQGADFVVTEYLIGTRALLERLSLDAFRRHDGGTTVGFRAWWHQLDLSDPLRPRLTCPIEELRRF